MLRMEVQSIKNWLAENALPIKLFVVSRTGLFLVVYLSLVIMPVLVGDGLWRGHPQNLLIDGWSRWDSGWLGSISEQGYTNIPQQIGVDTAFFPLYPLTLRYVSYITGDTHVSGILVSNIAFLLSLLVLHKLLQMHFNQVIVSKTLTLITFSAFSFFFSAVYTESVFLLFIVCTFYFGARSQFFWSAIFAALASATRVLGFVLAIPLLLMYLEQKDYKLRNFKPNILVFLLMFMGLLSFMVYLSLKFGNPLEFIAAQSQWNTLNPLHILPNVQNFINYRIILAGNFPAMDIINSAFFVVALILAFVYRKQVGLPYTTFSTLMVMLSSTRILGMGRYTLVVFPLFIALAYFLKNRDFYLAFLYFSILFLALFSIMFSHWYWVA